MTLQISDSHSPRAAPTEVSILSYQDKWTKAVSEAVRAHNPK